MVLLSDTKVLLAFRRPGRPTRGHGWVPRHGMERKAPSFVIQMTNGTGSIRQFASKAARCKARAAFEPCGSPAVVGTAGWRHQAVEHNAEEWIPASDIATAREASASPHSVARSTKKVASKLLMITEVKVGLRKRGLMAVREGFPAPGRCLLRQRLGNCAAGSDSRDHRRDDQLRNAASHGRLHP